MNKSIINNNSGKQKENQSIIVREDGNLSEYPFFIGIENRKVFDIRSIAHSFSNEQGKICDVNIKILYHPELGTLNTFDQRVYFCLTEVWDTQGQPGTAVFSLRQIAEMLGRDNSNTKPIKESLKRLRSVGIDWCGAFYDFSEKKYIHVENPFTILNHLAIYSTNQRVIRDKICEFAFDRHIVNNYLSNGTRPINRLEVQSLNSSAQLLYVLLDREMYGTNEYSILTANLFQKLGLTAKRWQKLSNRVNALYEWRDDILGKYTGYNEFFNYFEVVPSKTRDKKLVVRRTGAMKIALIFDCKQKNIQQQLEVNHKSPPETQYNARSEPLETQPIQTVRQEEKALRTQYNAPSTEVKQKPKQSKSKQEPKLPAYEFLTLFAQLFPKAKAPERASKPILENVNKFIDTHGLERAKDFLVYCAELGKLDNFTNIMEGSTFNWLYNYKLGDQPLIDSWLNERARDIRCNQEQIKLNKERKYNIWLGFQKKYYGEYYDFILKQIPLLPEEYNEKFERFKKERSRNPVLKPDSDDRLARCFTVFCENENLDDLAPYFIEWAYKFKTEEYLAIRHCRDTGKEGRREARLGWD